MSGLCLAGVEGEVRRRKRNQTLDIVDGIIVVCLLASALKKKAWPYALLSFVGILNLGIYIHLICEAAKVLKEHNSR